MQRQPLALGALLAALASSAVATDLGTAFTYQGRLCDGAVPANGYYDFECRLFDVATGGAFLNPPGVKTCTAVYVTNGLFTTNIDFGLDPFAGAARWLEISARSNGVGSYLPLAQRQELKPTPYALYATGAGVAATAGAVAAGSIDTPALAIGAVDSSRIANGSVLTNHLSPGLLLSTFWRLYGNAGTAPGTHFLGTTDNQALEFKVNGSRALRLEPSGSEAPNVIGGARFNEVRAGVVGATIAGGGAVSYSGNALTNQVLSDFGSIGGGSRQLIERGANSSTIAGGYYNAIGTNANAGAIGGGRYNSIGGETRDAVIAGGYDNDIGADADYSVVAGGTLNKVGANTADAVIAGGHDNTVGTNSDYSVISGGYGNDILDGSWGSVITGGRAGRIGDDSPYSFVGGGFDNDIAANAAYSTIVGGRDNSIAGQSTNGVVVAGSGNSISTYAANSFIGGGFNNALYPSTPNSFIGGGVENNILASSSNSVIVGGFRNAIEDFSTSCSIGGGEANRVAAGAHFSAIGGGSQNAAMTMWATIGGGRLNTNSDGWCATIPGGSFNYTSGSYSFAAGLRARATNRCSFVWGDGGGSGGWTTSSWRDNTFTVRAVGGTRFYSDEYGSGVELGPGDATWTSISDRNLKKDRTAVDGREVLEKLAAVPIEHWRYQWEDGSSTPHLGPMAQDFKHAFFPGRDDRRISTLEFDGVALAAIQGLNQKVEAERQKSGARSQKLEAENVALKKEVAELKALVRALAEKVNGGGVTGSPDR